jgi:hypothetical protein
MEVNDLLVEFLAVTDQLSTIENSKSTDHGVSYNDEVVTMIHHEEIIEVLGRRRARILNQLESRGIRVALDGRLAQGE